MCRKSQFVLVKLVRLQRQSNLFSSIIKNFFSNPQHLYNLYIVCNYSLDINLWVVGNETLSRQLLFKKMCNSPFSFLFRLYFFKNLFWSTCFFEKAIRFCICIFILNNFLVNCLPIRKLSFKKQLCTSQKIV